MICRSRPNILPKSIPKSTKNRSRDALGTPRGAQGPPGGLSGASRERPRGAPGAPGGSPGPPRDAPTGARERSGARRGTQNRPRVASGSEKIEFSSHGAFAKPRRSDFSKIFVDFRVFPKVCEVPPVPRLPAKTEGRPSALRVASLARGNLEKRRKSLPKLTQNRRKSCLRAPRAPCLVDFCFSN